MHSTTLLQSLLRYKAWANEELLLAMQSLEGVRHSEERHSAIRIWNHTYVVDRIFAAHLQRLRHEFIATNTTVTPDLEGLSEAVRESDRWYVGYVDAVTPTELAEKIDFTFTDGDQGRMSREEMLAHVVNHGSYHRGAIGRILSQISIAPPRDVFTGYLGGGRG
jgi:uncharacterized damage-inducible protein DinB